MSATESVCSTSKPSTTSVVSVAVFTAFKSDCTHSSSQGSIQLNMSLGPNKMKAAITRERRRHISSSRFQWELHKHQIMCCMPFFECGRHGRTGGFFEGRTVVLKELSAGQKVTGKHSWTCKTSVLNA